MSHTKKVENTFDEWAQNGRAAGMESGHFPRAEEALEAMDFMRGSKLLDIGCGNGWATRWLKERTGATGYVAGIDLSLSMIEEAQKLSLDLSRIEFHQASFSNLPWPDNHFDHAFSMEALYYAENVEDALREIRRVLRVRGTFTMCIDFYKENVLSHGWPADMDLDLVFLSEAEWGDLLQKMQFQLVRSWRCMDPRPVDPDLPPEKKQAEEHFRTQVGSLAICGRKTL